MTNTALVHLRTAGALLLAFLSLSFATAQEAGDWDIERWRWSGSAGDARVIEVRNDHGDVRCRPADGDEVLVMAVMQSHREDPYEARVEIDTTGERMRIEVVWRAGDDGTGGDLPEGAERRRVDLTLLVPAAPVLEVRTVDGLIEAKGIGNSVRAVSSRGDVTISTAGSATSRTEHGATEVVFRSTAWAEAPRLETETGQITVWLPATADARVEARTEGILSTDYSLEITREASGRRKTALAVLGEGKHRLTISSVKGDVRLFQQPG